MKRFFALLLIFIIIGANTTAAIAAFTSGNILKLITAEAVGTTGGGRIIPALITGTTTGGLPVRSWLPLTVPGTAAATIAASILGIGAGLATDYLILQGAQWMAARQYRHLNDGTITQDVTTTTYEPSDPEIRDSFEGHFVPGTCAYWTYSYPSLQFAPNATIAQQIYMDSVYCGGGGATYTPQIPGWQCMIAYDARTQVRETKNVRATCYPLPTNPATMIATNHTTTNTISNDTMKASLNADLAANNIDAKKVADAAVQVAANNLENPGMYDLSAAQNAAFQTALKTGISTGQLTILDGQGTSTGSDPLPDVADRNALTPAQVAAGVQAALNGQGLSAAQIAAAIAAAQGLNLTQAQVTAAVAAAGIGGGGGLTAEQQTAAFIAALTASATGAASKAATKEALDDETGVQAQVDPSLILPEKLSLTVVLTSFMGAINSLPIIQTLRGLTVNCAGTSTLCLQLPTKYGGNNCYNASGLTDAFNMIGSVLLSMTTIMGFIWLFKG